MSKAVVKQSTKSRQYSGHRPSKAYMLNTCALVFEVAYVAVVAHTQHL